MPACSDSTSLVSASVSSTGDSTGVADTSTSSPPTTTTPTTTDASTTSTTDASTTSTTVDGSSTSTTSTTSTTGDPSTTAVASTGDASTTGEPPPCNPGELLCACLPGEFCSEGVCILGDCAPYSGQCETEFDLYCDEPDFCAPGTDPFDCCATQQDGVCEEKSFGGTCPKGSDFWDCGYCPFENDGFCDDGFCPPGSEPNDCCATVEDGVCEEVDQGGACPDGSDYYDCGECPYANDGFCDEPFCPPGSDGDDCCATPEDGVCEEVDQGGMCPDGTDFYDCGECPFTNDGFCDEPFPCPANSDPDDCCATPDNGVCEEIDQGGLCLEGTDFYDCGECPFTDDGFCDEPDLCPPGSDTNDCP